MSDSVSLIDLRRIVWRAPAPQHGAGTRDAVQRTAEFDAFGPWLLEVTSSDGWPRAFRDYPFAFASILVSKEPRNVTRREANPERSRSVFERSSNENDWDHSPATELFCCAMTEQDVRPEGRPLMQRFASQ